MTSHEPVPQAYQLAQINIALMKAPLHDPIMAEFASGLDQVNAIADQSPGFVWRLKDEGGNATRIRAFADERILVNLSVWSSLESLKTYVYQSLHGEFFVRRHNWFEKYQEAHFAMWWIPAGHIPSIEEAGEKLDHLQQHGDSEIAFTFAKPYPSPLESYYPAS
ncbi:DUF3291 domain-containing protein [Leptolyngbya ohadii]|uniref:DUF3291 domain-containing protein n=1 Tax=Leptolyngbya ohadii TaxID=1962290 RepID=UPI000B59E762|nr:DUF3291 domain-containing protein [Leptolyngbya ohadii]